MGSNLAGVSVFSNLTLTRLCAAIVRNPRSCLWLYVRFERFFAWQRLDCCWRSGVSEPKLCFFKGSKGDVQHSVCVFFAWHGLESCWCFGLFESDADETLSSHRSESTFLLVVICAFRTVFCLAKARLLLAFGCFGTEALFFMGSKGEVKHSVCVFFAWHGLEACWCFGLFESDADETLSSHRSESTLTMCVSNAFLLGRGSTAVAFGFVFHGLR